MRVKMIYGAADTYTLERWQSTLEQYEVDLWKEINHTDFGLPFEDMKHIAFQKDQGRAEILAVIEKLKKLMVPRSMEIIK